MNTTDQLIEQLALRAAPVHPIAPPAVRTLRWLASGLVVVTAMLVLLGLRADIAVAIRRPGVVADLLLSLAIASTASYAAFYVSVPGRSARIAWWCVPPLLTWLALMGWNCAQTDGSAASASVLAIFDRGVCAAAITAIGIPVALLTYVSTRFATATRPHLAAGLGALAATSLASFAVSLHHSGETAPMVLIWHGGAVLAFSALAAAAGRRVFSWIGIVRV